MKKILFILFVIIPCTVIGEVVIPMEKQDNGLYLVPCKVNGVPMKFIFDTGASTVNISMSEALFLLKNGHIQESDIRGTSHAQIANGEIVENTSILLRKIDIGGIEINDVEATVSHNLNAPLLLGQSAINKLGTIQLDGTNLIVKDHKGIEEQNDIISNLFRFGLILFVVAIISYLVSMVFSIYKKRLFPSTTNGFGEVLPKKSKYLNLKSMLVWFKSRKYILYIAYCILLLLSVFVIELHINNKRDKLYSELIGNIRNSFDDFNQSIVALDFNRIDELEYEEVSIPKFVSNECDDEGWSKRENKRKRKQWNNMFSGIEHVYKITDQGWQMAGMQYTFIPDKDGYVQEGIQDYCFSPYMICVPEGSDFNKDIAKKLIERSLDKVYCEPDQYNTAAEIISTHNDYFNFIGNTFLQDSKPESCMHFYNERTGTDPIYESNKFTGYYWFGMQIIGQYRVIFAYANSIAWRIEEKEGFNASTKDRIFYCSLAIILLTIFLSFLLYLVKIQNATGTDD